MKVFLVEFFLIDSIDYKLVLSGICVRCFVGFDLDLMKKDGFIFGDCYYLWFWVIFRDDFGVVILLKFVKVEG